MSPIAIIEAEHRFREQEDAKRDDDMRCGNITGNLAFQWSARPWFFAARPNLSLARPNLSLQPLPHRALINSATVQFCGDIFEAADAACPNVINDRHDVLCMPIGASADCSDRRAIALPGRQ
jgi:hypothetical protein